MLRDFTLANLSRINQLINKVSLEENSELASRATQLKSTHSKTLPPEGYALLNNLIQQNSDLSELKSNSKNQLDTIFNNVSALDTSYAEDTYSALESLKNAIKELTNAFEITSVNLNNSNTTQEIQKLFMPEILDASLQGFREQIESTYDNLYKKPVSTIKTLANALNMGYKACIDSTDPIIADIIKNVENDPRKDKQAIFVELCLRKQLNTALKYGFAASEPLDKNIETVKADYEKAFELYKDPHGKNQSDNCVLFGLYPFDPKGKNGCLSDFLDDTYNKWRHIEEDKILKGKYNPHKVTSASYAALTGETPRVFYEQKIAERHEPMHKNVALAISAGNENEPMKIKLPGQTHYIELYDKNGKTSVELGKQKTIVEKEIKDCYALMYKNKKGHPTEAAQTHVDVHEKGGTYSGVNGGNGKKKDVMHESLDNYPINQKTTGIDYVVLNIPD